MSKRIAVVIDDEIDLTNYLSSILEDHDFEIFTANEAKSGEILINEKSPDLILLDIMMPGRSGVQLLAKLKGKEQTKDIPLIMVTGIKNELNIDWGNIADNLKARKPDGFIEKPIDPEKLMKVVGDVLAGKGSDGRIIRG